MNRDQFEEALRAHPNPVIVDLWAPWCGPCRASKPVVEAVAREYEGRVDFLTINVDEHARLVRELNVSSIPTILLTREGRVIRKYTGVQSRETYRNMFETMTQPNETPLIEISSFDRVLRLSAGAALVGVGLATTTWLLIPIGGGILFLGIYDRCPIWRVIITKLKRRTP